jgi:hypothetical protein
MNRRRQARRLIRLLAIVAAIVGAVRVGGGKLLSGETGAVGYTDSDLRRMRVA